MPEYATRLGEVLLERYAKGGLTLKTAKAEISKSAEEANEWRAWGHLHRIPMALAYPCGGLHGAVNAIKKHIMAAKVADWFQDGEGI